MLLIYARHESGNINQCHQGDVEAVAKPDEPGCFVGSVDVQDPGQMLGLIADDAHRVAVEAAQAHHDVGSETLMDLHELLVIDDPVDNVPHVVGPVSVIRNQLSKIRVSPACAIAGDYKGRIVQIIAGEET